MSIPDRIIRTEDNEVQQRLQSTLNDYRDRTEVAEAAPIDVFKCRLLSTLLENGEVDVEDARVFATSERIYDEDTFYAAVMIIVALNDGDFTTT